MPRFCNSDVLNNTDNVSGEAPSPGSLTRSDLSPQAGRGEASAAQALWRGFRGRCPACGEGHMFRAFLKVADKCPHCCEELYHHRADDFPAYLVIVIVGHILVPIVLTVETEIAPAIWISMTLWPSLALVMTLGLLQPVKGAVVAIQWYGGMHGFEASKKARALAAAADVA
jgi:uncharacterized protein (DUF983 family)